MKIQDEGMKGIKKEVTIQFEGMKGIWVESRYEDIWSMGLDGILVGARKKRKKKNQEGDTCHTARMFSIFSNSTSV